MNKLVALSGFIGLALSIAGSAAFADVTLSYGGRLTEATGKPRATGVDLEFRFFHQASGGSPAANVVIEHDDVALVNGVFQRSLTLSDANAHTIFAAGQAVWIEVKDVTNGVTYPRQQFGVVPFALKVPVDGTSITYDSDGQLMSLSGGSGNMHTNDYDADLNDKADVADDADLLGGQPGSHYLNAANLTGTIADARIPATIARDGELPVVDGTTVAAAGAVMDGDFSSNGILTRTGVGAYAVVTDNSTNWNTAHTDRLKWDGGSVGLNASAGRSNLGLGTIATQDASAVAITGGTISGVTMTSLTSTGIDDNADALAITINASEQVGIGTTTPDSPLSVSGATGAPLRLHRQASAATSVVGVLYSANNTTPIVKTYAATYGIIDDATAGSEDGSFRIDTTTNSVSTEKLRVTSDGYVGIGTSNPTKKLHVHGDSVLIDGDTSAGTLALQTQSGVWAGNLIYKGPNSAAAETTYGQIFVDRPVTTAGLETGSMRFRVLEAGTNQNSLTLLGRNVGIGTISPTYSLDVSTSGGVRFGATSATANFSILRLHNPDATDGNGNQIMFSTDTTGVGATADFGLTGIRGIHTVHDHATRAGELAFLTSDAGNPTERVRIDSSGNVGIGIGNPTAKLHVSGTPGIDGIRFPDGSLQTTAASGSGYVLASYEVADGTNGGACVAGAWQRRPINSLKIDTVGSVSISSNQITLPAGTYRCSVSASTSNTRTTQIRLYNATAGATIANGMSVKADYWSDILAEVRAQFTLASPSTLQVEQQCERNYDTMDMGTPTTWTGSPETYMYLECWR